jgi:carbonic anhydrase
MIGLLHPENVTRLPIVQSWLRHGEAALSIVRNRNTARDEHSALEELIEENVLQQLHHLRTHPSVAGRLAEGTLALSGWVYDIGHGSVRIYDEQHRKFVPVTSEKSVTSGATSKWS